MRLPYVPDPPATNTAAEAETLARVQARRGATGLIPLDLALLHSFPVADGWNSFIGAIRTRTSLPAEIRELIICRVAVLNGAWFEWGQHAPLLQESGFDEAALSAVRDLETGSDSVLTPAQQAVVAYTDAMTKTVTVPNPVFQRVQEYFSDRETVDITATVAAYNCVSRFLVALDVGEHNL
ncbi:hypothetical protein ASPZODRAFT_131247 [Penicilliopsis zonata CBS 506.65]|uniref:Rhodanese domain-containing protein n=1 Tax=Penicilliopsis zonata CBS 506.65 TaxID=1073090 RepID=A0A1L9SKD1_9EURO|nr:hypothetical protein ASPZODRAFT_131247 [Penicilliopsis zonata CBS 506.65]OJJ47692.1 hypothetical protein ASPZODRAFT_131247 [Penicilliopsis zonata CBS 506.65]